MAKTQKHLHAFANHPRTMAAFREHTEQHPMCSNSAQLKIWDGKGEHWYRTISDPELARPSFIGVEFDTVHIHEDVPKGMRYGTSG